MAGNAEVPVWDRLVRISHWVVVAASLITLVTEDDLLGLHVAAGYVVAVVIAIRIAWGFVGPRHARFGDFVRAPAAVLAYLRDLVRLRAPRYLGHSPAGGAMVVALLLLLLLLVGTGFAAYAAEEHAGPLAPYFVASSLQTRDWLAAVHAGLANALIVLAFAHVAGVALASYAHKENLLWAMITGRKRAPNPPFEAGLPGPGPGPS